MQQVSGHWYRLFNYSAVGISALYIAAFTFFTAQGETSTLRSFGLYPVTAGLALVHVLYGLIIFSVLASKERNLRSLGMLSLGLFWSNIFIIMIATGGLDSPYIIIMFLITLIAGAYGMAFVVLSVLLISTYFVMSLPIIFESPSSISLKQYLMLILSYITLSVSYMLWRRIYEPNTLSVTSRLSNELKHEQVQSEVLIRSISDGVIVIDKLGAIQFFNPGASTLSGWKIEDAVDIHYRSVLKFVDGKGNPIDEPDDPFAAVLAKHEAFSSHDILLHSKEGDIVELSMSVSPVLDDDGELTAAVAVMRDISDQKQQERQRAEFISTASHEMRTPVAAIEGYIALALNQKVSVIDDKARTFLLKAHETTEHLGMLFRDLLTASKSEDGRLENHPEPVELGALLRTVTEEVKFSAEKKHLNLSFTIGGQEKASISPILYAYIDPERMREVIVNLIDNAIKFTEQGSITVDLSGSNESLLITITDTGLGIASEDLSHLFQKFYRIDNSATRTISGTGLGLFICKQILELYKGRIWAESELGKGTKFSITLPRLDQNRAERLIAQKKGDTDSVNQPIVPGTVIAQPEVDAANAAKVATQHDIPTPVTEPIPEVVAAPEIAVSAPTESVSPETQVAKAVDSAPVENVTPELVAPVIEQPKTTPTSVNTSDQTPPTS